MKLERALQADHSDHMRIVAAFVDEESARRAHEELIRHLEEIFSRADRFMCAGFGQGFESEEDFREWKAKKWDPVADERCTLEVERRPDGHIYVTGDYGLILDDWSRDDVGVALDCNIVAIRTYTAGYGIDYLDRWLSERGGEVDVEVEGCEYDFVPFETALEEIQAPPHPHGTGRVRAPHSDRDPT